MHVFISLRVRTKGKTRLIVFKFLKEKMFCADCKQEISDSN